MMIVELKNNTNVLIEEFRTFQTSVAAVVVNSVVLLFIHLFIHLFTYLCIYLYICCNFLFNFFLCLSPAILMKHAESVRRRPELLPYLAIVHVRDLLIPPSKK